MTSDTTSWLRLISEARSQLESAVAYLELHIEQGPVLESMDLPLGVVLGTFGVERHQVTWKGQAAHAGSTPMDKRRDALAGAAKLALEIRPIAAEVGDGAVCTSGGVVCKPGIVTSVVETAEQLLDQRHLNADSLARLLSLAQAASERFAVEEDGLANWPPATSDGLMSARGQIRVQWCHGAPGIVASLAGLAGDADLGRLLLAGGVDPAGAVGPVAEVDEPEAEAEHEQRSEHDEQDADPAEAEQQRDLGRRLSPSCRLEGDPGDDRAGDERERAEQMEEEGDVLHQAAATWLRATSRIRIAASVGGP